MAIQLLAFDLDGTLNNSQKVITPLTKAAIMAAQQRGIRVALASARPAPGLNREATELDLFHHNGILMSYNGGCIIDAQDGRVLYKTAMPLQQTRQVLRQLSALPVTPILDDGKQFYVESLDGYKVDYECRNNNMAATAVGPDLAGFLPFEPVKILMSVLPEQIQGIQARIAAFLPPSLTVVKTAPFYLEVLPAVINKGQGIRDVCAALGLAPEQAMAFGDAENDIPMLKTAGIGVAMGNADEAVKAAADYITLDNDHDGIAAALKHFLE